MVASLASSPAIERGQHCSEWETQPKIPPWALIICNPIR